MPLPKPVVGLVIRYSYLWADEAAKGRVEGVKDRPCAVILTTTTETGRETVSVLPITHAMPTGLPAVEIPAATKSRLGLDSERSWILCSEMNRFVWPGPDLRPVTRGSHVAYGLLPAKLIEMVRQTLLDAARQRALRVSPRGE